MKYSVDRIEEDVAILENIYNNDIKEVNINILPSEVKEGSILKYENDKYILDNEEELDRRKRIKNRFERLKKKKL